EVGRGARGATWGARGEFVMSGDEDGNVVEPSYEGMDALQLSVELSRNIQAVSVGRMTLDEANRRTRQINAVLAGQQRNVVDARTWPSAEQLDRIAELFDRGE